MIVRGAAVYTAEGVFEEKDIYIREGIFAAEPTGDTADCEKEYDAGGCYAVPGFTDIHFHGCVGKDFCDGTVESIDAMASYQASVGVTSIVPATMTMEEDTLFAAASAAAEYKLRQGTGEFAKGAVLCGIHMEGPFVSKEKAGAQNPNFVQLPNQELYEAMQRKSGGMVKLVAIAPELFGAEAFIRQNHQRSVMSVAHTTADYDTAKKAFEAGATHVTHLYNAMPAFSHREPGVIGAAADAGGEAELICDGIHVHPSAVRMALKLFGEDGVIFISDSMMATGLADGMYSLGGQPVTVSGKLATLKDGTIAGSVSNLTDCVKKAVLEMGVPLTTAVKCAAVNPAKCVGIYDKYGSITPGKVANLVLLDKNDLSVRQVLLRGKPLLQDRRKYVVNG